MPLPHFTCEVDPAALQASAIDAGLHGFNQSAADLGAVQRFCVYARNKHGALIGGALVRWWGSACEVQQMWVEEVHRGKGVGTAIMTEIEQAARDRGCKLVYLETFTFQAQPFYAKLGFGVGCRIDGFPDGGAKFIMTKQLD